ncbi:unnamed protein product [Ectocarpus sp. CCAP 1310/34]|nr:unnamed protein product [Ectocarpus sp. CCAP 1310/34]
MDNGDEFTRSAFTSFCDAAGIRCEYTAPNTSKQNALVESAIWRAMKGGYAARRHILTIGHVDLFSIPNVGVNGHRLWLASALWISACFNRSATKANLGWMSPFKAFFSRKPPLTVVPFFPEEGMMRVKRATKADVQSAQCFYLHGGNNHSTSTAVVLRADTGHLALTNNVVWVNRRAGALAPVPSIGGGSSVTAAPSPAAAVSAADAAPPPPPPSRTYTIPSPVADLRRPIIRPIVDRSHAAPFDPGPAAAAAAARQRRRPRSSAPAAFETSRQGVGTRGHEGSRTHVRRWSAVHV